jgi:pimeloyl-[acyl-carrier protein] synthase
MSLRQLIKPLVINAMLLREWWQSGITYNPISPRVFNDPYPIYAALRAKDPVHWSILMDSWVLTRYHDVDAILRDHRRYSNDGRNRVFSPRSRQAFLGAQEEPSMLFLDPPDHTRLRALVNKAFTPQTIEALEPRIRTIMAELLDQIEDPTAFDVIEAVANPLPVIVIAELLGVPPADRAQFKIWSDQRARTLEPTRTASELQEAKRAGEALDAYFLNIINERRQAPRNDLISALVAAEEAGDKLTEREMVIMLRLLLVAGNETTTNLIGNGMLALLRHPEQMQTLRDTPNLMSSAVEELLRYDSPVQTDVRIAMADHELDGRPIRKGQGVVLLIGAANHDPQAFPEPERLDLTRNKNSHIAFGRGIHHCLGAALARLEGRIAFEALLDRFGEMHLRTAQPAFKDHIVLRGLRTLPVGAK